MADLQTPISRPSGRAPASVRLTPHQRPRDVMTALRVAARSAPYAYYGGNETSGRRRAETPTTPTPPSSVISQCRPNTQRIPVSAETDDPKTDVENASILLFQQISKDPVDFNLYDAGTNTYRTPTQDEMRTLHEIFPSATEFRFEYPLLIVRCETPPTPIPLTVAAVAAVFLPANDDYEPIPGNPGNPRVVDFLEGNPYEPNAETQFEFLERLLATLQEKRLSPISCTFYLGSLVVELKNSIPAHTLPGRLGGIVPFYSNGIPAWKIRKICQSRLITPNQYTVDTSDYRTNGLTPGIRVCGVQHAGTTGLVIRNRHSGDRRVMVANHVFSDTDQVYHPTTSVENHIGTIVERFPNIDLALVRLDDHIEYHNATYFDAPTPKKFVTSQYDRVKRQGWFFLDSPFTGLVPFLWAGVRVGIRDGLPAQVYHGLNYDREYVLRSMGLNVGQLAEGVCGSPLVRDDYNVGEQSAGAVLGAFGWSDQNVMENIFVSVMDEIVRAGWDVDTLEV